MTISTVLLLLLNLHSVSWYCSVTLIIVYYYYNRTTVLYCTVHWQIMYNNLSNYVLIILYIVFRWFWLWYVLLIQCFKEKSERI